LVLPSGALSARLIAIAPSDDPVTDALALCSVKPQVAQNFARSTFSCPFEQSMPHLTTPTASLDVHYT
jgi:hypothetical protein